MRIIKLEIQNFRGITSGEFILDGKNLVLVGPNGTGKSGVVDSIDFLLTGKITRLGGTGTRNISLSKHGPHVNSSPNTSKVKATIKIDGIDEEVVIERSVSEPNKLKYDSKYEKEITTIINSCKNGQIVLSRKEILQFIASEAGTRANQIQQLLDLEEVQKVRQTLVSVKNKLKTSNELAESSYVNSLKEVLTQVGIKIFEKEKIIEYINNIRKDFNGEPLTELDPKNIRISLNFTSSIDSDISIIYNSTSEIKTIFEEISKSEIGNINQNIDNFLKDVDDISPVQKLVKCKHLTEEGIKLLDEGKCPLCDIEWEQEKLKIYLETKLVNITNNEKKLEKIHREVRLFSTKVDTVYRKLELIIQRKTKLDAKDIDILENWFNKLKEVREKLVNFLNYLEIKTAEKDLETLFCNNECQEVIKAIFNKYDAINKELSPKQLNWDKLAQLEIKLIQLEKDSIHVRKTKESYGRAMKLLEKFEEVRDSNLNSIYNHIKDDFKNMYIYLHGNDESSFEAKFEQDGSSLNLEVDFFGKGFFPPTALHSEGHQDSMGLCLFLALNNYLSSGNVDIIVLDDVVMSVDIDHRQKVCELIKEKFPNKQFIITTHDQAWARQLKSAGVVSKDNLIELINWSVDTGPKIKKHEAAWERIENLLKTGEMVAASGEMRSYLESFYDEACQNLEASVVYRPFGQYTLYDLLTPAHIALKKLLKIGKEVAREWSDKTKEESLANDISTLDQVYTRTQADQWMINAKLHFNHWANLSPKEFEGVILAFKDLEAHFLCNSCKLPIKLQKSGYQPTALKCPCSQVNTNLERKTT